MARVTNFVVALRALVRHETREQVGRTLRLPPRATHEVRARERLRRVLAAAEKKLGAA